MATLKVAVGVLNILAAIFPAVKQLGVRYSDYGVNNKHYGAVCEAPLIAGGT